MHFPETNTSSEYLHILIHEKKLSDLQSMLPVLEAVVHPASRC